MTNVQNFFIKCTRAFFEGKKTTVPSDVSLDELYEISKTQNLAAVVFSVIKDDENAKQSKAYKMLEDCFYDSIARYDFQSAIINEIRSLLESEKIRHVFFKGSVIKEYYPVPELRSMGDIDVLIGASDRDRVKALLMANGFELINSNGPVYDYKKDGALIEVHTKIVSGKVGDVNAEEYFSNAMQYAKFDEYCGVLEDEYHFCYLLTHIAHHFWFYGAGVKMILDLAVFQRSKSLDFSKVFAYLEELGLDDFARVLLTLCHKWYGVGKDYNSDVSQTEEFLLSYGAFGNAGRNKAAVVRRKALEEGKKSGFSAKLSLLFPSYKKIKDIPYMRFIQGRPYLLVLGWIYRIYYNLRYRKSFVVQATSSLTDDNTLTQAQRELQYFKEIGLL